MAVSAGDPELLGWPPDGPTLRLDYHRFSYAGKFVMSNTGKAVIPVAGPEGRHDGRAVDAAARAVDDGADDGIEGDGADDGNEGDGADEGIEGDDADGGAWDDRVLAAAAFNEDRTDQECLCIRYVTVRDDCRGKGLGPELCAFVADEAADRGYSRVRIAVNNPFAYEALYRAGFTYTGEETGLAELVLERPAGEAATRAPERSRSLYLEGLAIYAERDLTPAETAFLERKRREGPPDPRP